MGSKEAWELPTSGVASFRVEYHPESNTSGHYTFDHQVRGMLRERRGYSCTEARIRKQMDSSTAAVAEAAGSKTQLRSCSKDSSCSPVVPAYLGD